MTSKILIILFVIVVATGFAQYQCDWNVMSNGGGVMSSSNFATAVTVNQTAIGSLTGTNFLAYLGFWYPGIGTGIMEDKESEIIDPNILVTKLYSAKPNPFRTQTTIRYSLSAKEKTSLLIYDISGRLVTTLMNGSINPGIYSINWNGRNGRNQQVATGVYFYQLKTKDYTKTNKILLTQ